MIVRGLKEPLFVLVVSLRVHRRAHHTNARRRTIHQQMNEVERWRPGAFPMLRRGGNDKAIG